MAKMAVIGAGNGGAQLRCTVPRKDMRLTFIIVPARDLNLSGSWAVLIMKVSLAPAFKIRLCWK